MRPEAPRWVAATAPSEGMGLLQGAAHLCFGLPYALTSRTVLRHNQACLMEGHGGRGGHT